MSAPFASLLHPSKKGLSFPFSLGKRICLETQLKGEFTDFKNFHGAPCFHWQSRKRMMNTFIIVNITPIYR